MQKPSYIHLLYTSRAFEWIHLRQLFLDCMVFLHLDDCVKMLEDIVFSWSYQPLVSYSSYQPYAVFCNFNIATLNNNRDPYNYQSGRFRRFVGPLTLGDKHILSAISHVRTTKLSIILKKLLRKNLQRGLNYIPLETTWFNEVISKIISTWEQFSTKLNLSEDATLHGTRWLQRHARRQLV